MHRNIALNMKRHIGMTAKETNNVPKKCARICTTVMDATVQSDKSEQETNIKKSQTSLRLGSNFYNQDCISLAKALLGKILVRLVDGVRITGRIVETEAYLGVKDSACHSYKGRKTHRNQAMFMMPGSLYVYIIYGMYHCMNISCKGEGSVVLLRAVEPLEGENMMRKFRSERRKSSKELKTNALCSGPGKLSDALKVTKELFDKDSLILNPAIWLEDAPLIPPEDIVSCTRIGLDNVPAESRDKLQRYYVLGNRFISKRDKVAEAAL